MAGTVLERACELDERLIAEAAKIRFYPFVAESGRGSRLMDVAGREYLDFTASWAVANAGYDHPGVLAAVKRQLGRSTFLGHSSTIHEPALRLAEKLVELLPGDFEKKVWFGLSGSDASETVARLLPLATGKRRFVSFIGSYHGSTAASMALSGHIALSAFIGGGNVIKAPYPHPYRPPFGAAEGCAEACIRFLEDYLFKTICPPGDVCGVIVEAVQSDGGDIIPPPEFLPMLAELCRRHDLCLVLDEVKIGLGRTGQMFGFQHAGVTPDVVILGKSLGGGLPLSAVVARREILDVGTALSMYTTAGNALSCAAGLAAIRAVEEDGLAENARAMGRLLNRKLASLAEKHPLIGDVRGLGLIQGVELVRDRKTKEPAAIEAAKVVYRAFELGLLLYYVGTFSNVIEITPPLILTEAEVEEGAALLDQALGDVEAGRVSDECVARYAGW